MVAWVWVVIALVVGACFGVVLQGLLVAASDAAERRRE